MKIKRRQFLKRTAALAAFSTVPGSLTLAAPAPRSYPYLGRTDDYNDFRIIEPGLAVAKVESWTQGQFGIVRVATRDGREGYGQLSSCEPDITATVLHRQVARHVLGSDPAHIDALADRVIDANMKFPWTYVCRALAGVDTALWDLYGKVKGKPVCELLGGKTAPFPVYGSSMRRDISPEDEAARLVKLRDTLGFKAFKVRLGVPTGHDRDASPGRTEKLIPTVRKAVGDDIQLMGDGNSCFTPPKAIEVGRRLEADHYFWFEEPCPYWELEWTAEVAAALKMHVAGGEQDNDLAQWRRLIAMNAVDVLQPDLCYIGGFTRAWRVAKMGQKARKLLVPHSSHLSLVTLFSLHFMAAIPNAGPFVEFSIEEDANAGELLYSPALKVRDGKVKLPDGPGWGVTINPRWLEKAAYLKSERPA
ncbi:MAG TPA: mandelate racemase/muconate lactonizing enzyme family protein [Candidatus Acidoferrum sp.]|jgi:L-alanine-DL-glutamate epimerase-like enolase superfamily enzyme|nr:mandelate racemase/muconate lactonizing enzyme family protein [Candidatus Acidoferrum sp.]